MIQKVFEFQIPVTKLPINGNQKIANTIEEMVSLHNPYLVQYITEQQKGISLIALGHLVKVDSTKIQQKFNFIKQVLLGIQGIQSRGYVFHTIDIKQCLYQQNNIVKIGYHNCTKTSAIEVKKTGSLCNGPQLYFEDIDSCYFHHLNIWKIGLFLLNCLWQWNEKDQLSKYKQSKDQKTKKYGELVINIKKRKYQNQDTIFDLVKKCLLIEPKQRTTIEQILKVVQEAIMLKNVVSQEQIMIGKQKYLQKQQGIKSIYLLQIKQKILLNEEVRKKIANHLKVQTGKNIKKFKDIYRGSYFDFSSQLFYQQCFNYGNILIVIKVKGEKNNKICAYSVEQFNLYKLNGVFGNFIQDYTGKSFIFSTLNDQFYKLKDLNKAIGVSMLHGPIFGNCDIVIGDRVIQNYTKFPSSYSSGRRKNLTKTQYFQIQQYDAYHIQF